MDGNFGGLGLCVTFCQDRCPYADPYYFCAYHGIETDLLNLTACWGYELWRFSTTCTLVIESVKATSVIFLLGFGSFVCYKLYNHYKKNIGGGSSSSRGKRFKLRKWASDELLDSLSDIDNDVHNIESKYFGPDEITATTNDEITSPGSDGENSSSLSLDSSKDDDDETSWDLSDTDQSEMGNFSSHYEPVVYSTESGISFADSFAGDRIASSVASARSWTKSIFVRPGVEHKRRRRNSRSFNLGNVIPKKKLHASPVELTLLPSSEVNGTDEEDDDDYNSDHGSFYDNCRPGSDADVESVGSPSINVFGDSENEEDLAGDAWQNSDTASLNANFSPGSLRGRCHLLDRLPPDGADFIEIVSPTEDDISEALRQPLTFQDDNFCLDTDSEEVFTSSTRGEKRGCLARDRSFDSTASDISGELFCHDDIGSSTLANLDHLLAHLEQVKQTCLSLDANIDHLRGTSYANMDTLKSPLSEYSDISGSQSTSAMDLVRKYKSRATFRGLLDTGVAQTVTSESTATDSSGLPNDHASLEWDTAFPSSKRKCVAPSTSRAVPSFTSGVNMGADSGSDFGASLTSGSPEPVKYLQPNSPASLEWEEEFNGDSLPTSPRKLFQLPELKHLEQHLLNTNIYNFPTDERIVPGQSKECSPDDRPLLSTSNQSTSKEKLFDPANDWLQHGCINESGFVDDSKDETTPVARRRRRRKSPGGVLKTNRDSAFCDGSEIGFSRMQENIGEKWELISYSKTEWRGHTTRAETIRKGYAHIPETLDCIHLRRIRGDNYCALRASLFQVLREGLCILDKFSGCENVCKMLEDWANGRYQWLKNWSFGNRLPYSRDTCIQGFRDCLSSLDRLSLSSMHKKTNREEFLVDQFNSDPDLDVRLMEAVKLLVFTMSVQLYEANITGIDVPIFAILLFARETSDTPQRLMENHLNYLGDSGGLEQVEMCLLGHTLGVTLRVVRPSTFGNEDYISRFPDNDGDTNIPEVNLIAEDDRHYNIILK